MPASHTERRGKRTEEMCAAMSFSASDRERSAVLDRLWQLWISTGDMEALDAYLGAILGGASDQQDV